MFWRTIDLSLIRKRFKGLEYPIFQKIHDEYIQKSRQMSKSQDSAGKAMKHHNYLLKGIRETIKQLVITSDKK